MCADFVLAYQLRNKYTLKLRKKKTNDEIKAIWEKKREQILGCLKRENTEMQEK